LDQETKGKEGKRKKRARQASSTYVAGEKKKRAELPVLDVGVAVEVGRREKKKKKKKKKGGKNEIVQVQRAHEEEGKKEKRRAVRRSSGRRGRQSRGKKRGRKGTRRGSYLSPTRGGERSPEPFPPRLRCSPGSPRTEKRKKGEGNRLSFSREEGNRKLGGRNDSPAAPDRLPDASGKVQQGRRGKEEKEVLLAFYHLHGVGEGKLPSALPDAATSSSREWELYTEGGKKKKKKKKKKKDEELIKYRDGQKKGGKRQLPRRRTSKPEGGREMERKKKEKRGETPFTFSTSAGRKKKGSLALAGRIAERRRGEKKKKGVFSSFKQGEQKRGEPIQKESERKKRKRRRKLGVGELDKKRGGEKERRPATLGRSFYEGLEGERKKKGDSRRLRRGGREKSFRL